jgi:outer membrane protein insertion porin family
MLAAFATVLSFSCSVFADTVSKIEFRGLDRVEKEVISRYVTIKPNRNFGSSDIDNTLKGLFSSGFFADIKIAKEGNTLVIKFTERPMVDQVAFEGNSSANDNMLKNVVGDRLTSGHLFSLAVIKDILSDFQLLYKALGYYSSVVTPKIIKLPGNKVNVVFEIKEGSKTTVKKIVFVGNKSFRDSDLKDVMGIKEERIWRFWDTDSHIFREDKVETDVNAISSFYKNHGYPFFIITSTSSEMGFDKQSHYCTFTMEEGDRYTFSGVSLTSEVEKIKASEFKDYITIKKGSLYNESLINTTRSEISKKIALKNNPFIDVTSKVDFDKEKKTAFVSYVVVKMPKIFVERIVIIGNTKTFDNVIRREFPVHEGDPMNAYKIQDAVEKLKYIGYFDDVEVSELPGSTNDKKVLQIKVHEKESTAQINFGLNVSTVDGFGGMIGFSESNFGGTGRTLGMEVFWAQKTHGCKITLFDPRFLDQNFGVGVNIGADSHNRKDTDQSIMKSIYISPFVKYNICSSVSHTVRYTLTKNKKLWWNKNEKKSYDKVPDDVPYSVLMKDEYGKYTSSEISSTLVYSNFDNQYTNQKGYELSMTNSYAGVSGNVKYFKTEFGAKYYYPLTEKATFITDANIGFIKEVKNTRSNHRYSLGGDGNSMRGFDSCGVGTRSLDGSSVGGNKFWTLSFIVKAPLSSQELGINGITFLDFGSAWGSKYPKKLLRDSRSIRASIGVGIEWQKCPLGMPISFIFGFPLRKTSFDEKHTFTLTGLM